MIVINSFFLITTTKSRKIKLNLFRKEKKLVPIKYLLVFNNYLFKTIRRLPNLLFFLLVIHFIYYSNLGLFIFFG